MSRPRLPVGSRSASPVTSPQSEVTSSPGSAPSAATSLEKPLSNLKREKFEHFSVRVVKWQFDALCKRSNARGISLGEVLRAILDQTLAGERTS